MDKRIDRRVRKTQKAILDAFSKLAEIKPINQITVSEITEKCDISRTTFYLHYKDVYDLLEQIESDIFDNFIDFIGNVSLRDGVPHGFFSMIIEYFYEHPEARIVLSNKHGNVTIDRKIGALFKKKFTDEMQIEGETNKKYFAAYVIHGFIGIMETWFNGGMQEGIKEIAKIAENLTQNTGGK